MPSQVQHMSPDLYRRLLILDPPPPKRRVSFSDLNEVRSYEEHDPPAKIAKRAEVEVLRERVRQLEHRLEKLTYKPQSTNKRKDKENMPQCLHIPAHVAREMNLQPLPRLVSTSVPSTPGSAHSVTSPYRPVSDTNATRSSRPRSSSRHTRTDNTPPPMPAHLHRAIQASSAVPPTPANTRVQAPAQLPPQQSAQPIPSRAKRFILGLGALCAVATVPTLVAGIVVLGPAGLGVAAGVAVLGMALIAVGSRMK